eukprot:2925971-Prymnesium_polylepis.2
MSPRRLRTDVSGQTFRVDTAPLAPQSLNERLRPISPSRAGSDWPSPKKSFPTRPVAAAKTVRAL